MKFRIQMKESNPGWDVHYYVDPQQPAFATRRLASIGVGPATRPVPESAADQQPIAALLANNGAPLTALIGRVASRTSSAADIEQLGRWVHLCLLGEAVWKDVLDRRNGESIELELLFEQTERTLTRVPWEAARDTQSFLASMTAPEVSLVRIVRPRTAPTPLAIDLPARVLFAIAGDANEAKLEAGAEYLALVRRLEASRLDLHSRLLLRASPNRLRAAIEEFDPQVVHLIAHGTVAGGTALVSLIADPNAIGDVTAAELVDILSLTQARAIPIVILSACETNAQPDASPPFAVELASYGAPLVVGMAGRIQDPACRLFSAAFYEALARGISVDLATARARRAGLAARAGATQIDWALPNLVAPEGLAMTLHKAPTSRAGQVRQARAAFVLSGGGALFCDRVEVFGAYGELMRDLRAGGVAAALAPRNPVRVIAIQVSQISRDGDQLGATRALEELSVKAWLDGMLPCLVRLDQARHPPGRLIDVAWQIVEAAQRTCSDLLPTSAVSAGEVGKVRGKLSDPARTPAFAPEVRRLLDSGEQPDSTPVIRAALQRDFASLHADTRRRPIVILDCVHAYGDLSRLFACFDGQGLGTGTLPAPVVFSCARHKQPSCAEAGDAIQSFLEKPKSFVRVLTLAAMCGSPNEAQVYQQHLLGLSLMANPETAEEYFDLLHSEVEGVPSRLPGENAPLIRHGKKWKKVLSLDDDTFLEGL